MKETSVTIEGKVVRAKVGTSLSEVLEEAGLFLAMPCAGAGTCGKCRVRVRGEASAIEAQEKKLLSETELSKGIRLACKVKVAETPLHIQRHESEGEAQNIHTGESEITVTQPLFSHFGIAIDVGTTTLAAKLFDETGVLAVAACKNSQGQFGADVMSRIEKALDNRQRALQEAIAADLNALVQELTDKAGCALSNVDTVAICGNTAMLYLLTGTNPISLSALPFEADRLFGEWVHGEELLLSSLPNARVYLCNCISAFVGADITAAVLATELCQTKKSGLLVDIGTNGEMALWQGGALTCCATAAGPAFEGAQLHSGMLAQNGAIDRIWFENGALQMHTLGNATPRGICASGILDAVYALLLEGAIDESGYLDEGRLEELGLFCEVNGQSACKLAENVFVTQRDIRQIQLAKSAICAGIETLLTHTESEVETLFLAGGFGSYLDLQSAVGIGLVPKEFEKKTKVVGNAALDGTCKILCHKENLDTLGAIPKTACSINLAEHPLFMDAYVENMCFSSHECS